MKTIRRRRKERKTDYKKRIKILKGNLPRIVFRKTNRYLLIQYIKSKEAQDTVIFGFDSRKLLEYGWPKSSRGGLKSLPAAYLIGYLAGTEIMKRKLEIPIVDFGMARVISKSKIHSFIKGLVDSGIKIKHKKEAFPDDSKIKGEFLKNKISFEEIKKRITENKGNKNGKEK